MPTVTELLEQAKTLDHEDRKELIKQLVDTIDVVRPNGSSNPQAEDTHWGKNLLRLLDDVGPIDLVYPEIEDSVDWVKQIREDNLRQRLGDWGTEE